MNKNQTTAITTHLLRRAFFTSLLILFIKALPPAMGERPPASASPPAQPSGTACTQYSHHRGNESNCARNNRHRQPLR